MPPINPLYSSLVSLIGAGVTALAARYGQPVLVVFGLLVVIFPHLVHALQVFVAGPTHTREALAAAVEAEVKEATSDPAFLAGIAKAVKATGPLILLALGLMLAGCAGGADQELTTFAIGVQAGEAPIIASDQAYISADPTLTPQDKVTRLSEIQTQQNFVAKWAAGGSTALTTGGFAPTTQPAVIAQP